MKSILPSAIVLAMCITPIVHAATLAVTTLADSGAGSLRAAIGSANDTAGIDTIRFQPGVTGTIQLASEILIADSVLIEGPGPQGLTIAGSANSRIFRLDRASGVRSTTTLSGLTLSNGHAGEGGAIYGDDENLVVRDAVFRDNASSTRGGAIRLANGDLTLTDVEMAGNESGVNNAGVGGALSFNSGTLRMTRCLLRGNSAGYGGGLYAGTPAPHVVIEDSVFVDNTSYYAGGAISASTTMPSFHVARSSFIGNSAAQPTGAAINYGGSTSPGTAPAVIENSTFSGNSTPHPNGRGIIAVLSGTLHLRNSTLAHNRTASVGSAAPDEGGAVWVGNATLNIESTLFSQNMHGPEGTVSRVDIAPSSPSTRTLNVSHSLLHTTPSAGLINGTNTGNLFDTNAQLLPLGVEGGGFAPVHPISRNSPAVDAGSNPASLTTDQRGPGFARAVAANACHRPLVARADIGAFEYRADTLFCHNFDS